MLLLKQKTCRLSFHDKFAGGSTKSQRQKQTIRKF